MNQQILILCCMAILSGCTSSNRQIIAEDNNFIVIKPSEHDNWASIAEKYLGRAEYASILVRYNPDVPANTSSSIAIPVKNFNPAAVFSDGYQLVPILCYHQFSNKPGKANSMVVSATSFEQQMAYLQQNNYRVISLTDFHAFMKGDLALPDKSVVITVDDGFKSYIDVAYPILKKYGFASTLFIYPEFIGAGVALNWDDIAHLNQDPLVDIESHSKTHNSLSMKAKGEDAQSYRARLITEVKDTEQILQRKIQRQSQYFAYPYGNTSGELVTLLSNEHYHLGLTVKKGSNPSFASPYLLRRTMIYGEDSLDTFIKQLDGFKKVNLK